MDGRRLALAGRTQAQLAAYLGIGKAHVSQMLSAKRRMSVDTFRKIEAFLAAAEGAGAARGVAEARASDIAPPREKSQLSKDERERLVRELIELGDAYKTLPRRTTLTDEEILGYDERGLPT